MADMSFVHIKITKVSLSHYKSLPKGSHPKNDEWTILSCIVQQIKDEFEVVSLGTGSKCIGATKMCPDGTILNDSHAEIMCRRSFLRYLYDQLSSDGSIFDFDAGKSKFILKNDVEFHFFTTHTPCGDAAIFPKENEENYGEILEETPSKKRKIDDIHRTGAKCLENEKKQDLKTEGSGYHIVGAIRRKPGRGDPTLSVSCSDKISKWCHLGIQGALLSILLEKPIYLKSFTIIGNTPFCKKAFKRAAFERFENSELNKPYSLHRFEIYQVTEKFEFVKTETKQPSPTSLSWAKVNKKRQLEVAVEGRKQGVTKKNINTEAGRLKICKLELFKEFVNILKLKKISLELEFPLQYKKAKNVALHYQNAWKILKQTFKVWTHKDETLLRFIAE